MTIILLGLIFLNFIKCFLKPKTITTIFLAYLYAKNSSNRENLIKKKLFIIPY